MTLCCTDKEKQKKTKAAKIHADIEVTKDLTQAQIVVSALDLAIQVKLKQFSSSNCSQGSQGSMAF